jgi:hypothetical protein
MAHIDRAYVALALAFLIVGEMLGLYMGIASDLRLRTVHSTIMLPGFVVLAIYGFMFRLWPAMKTGPAAAAQFWLGTISAVALVIGSYQFVTTGAVMIVAPASILAIVAAAFLLWLFWTRSAEA